MLESMPTKEKEDLQRVVFFQGSFFYSSRRIPGLEPDKLPLDLPIAPEKAEGDSAKIVQVMHYVTPIELKYKDIDSSAEKEGQVSFDKRCADCTSAFKDLGALLQHWYVKAIFIQLILQLLNLMITLFFFHSVRTRDTNLCIQLQRKPSKLQSLFLPTLRYSMPSLTFPCNEPSLKGWQGGVQSTLIQRT